MAPLSIIVPNIWKGLTLPVTFAKRIPAIQRTHIKGPYWTRALATSVTVHTKRKWLLDKHSSKIAHTGAHQQAWNICSKAKIKYVVFHAMMICSVSLCSFYELHITQELWQDCAEKITFFGNPRLLQIKLEFPLLFHRLGLGKASEKLWDALQCTCYFLTSVATYPPTDNTLSAKHIKMFDFLIPIEFATEFHYWGFVGEKFNDNRPSPVSDRNT